MEKRIAAISMALSAAVLAGCASIKAEDVKVYTPAQLRQGEYETVKRLWVETWRTPFWVPSYSSPKDGIEALQDKAAALGANGLINVIRARPFLSPLTRSGKDHARRGAGARSRSR